MTTDIDMDERNDRIAELEAHVEVLQSKIDGEKSCACGYDRPSDVCAAHSPALMKANARAEAAEAKADAMKTALAQATQQEFSMARRMRAAVVEARRVLAQTRFNWNGPVHRADGILAEALSVDCPVRSDNAPQQDATTGANSATVKNADPKATEWTKP